MKAHLQSVLEHVLNVKANQEQTQKHAQTRGMCLVDTISRVEKQIINMEMEHHENNGTC